MFSVSNAIRFDCCGTWRQDGHIINPNGFFKCYSPTLENDCINTNEEITLFGKKYQFWEVLESDIECFFDMSRQVFLELLEYEIDPPRNNNSRQETFESLRSDVSGFLYYMDCCLKLCLQDANSFKLSNDAKVKFDAELYSMKAFIHDLDRYFFHEQFLLQCTYPSQNLASNAAYQFIHCCLDFRWFYILIKNKLSDGNEIKLYKLFPHISKFEDDIYLFIMSEVVMTSIIKFEFEENMSVGGDVIICPCFKEILALLFKNLGLEEFWERFSLVMRTISEPEWTPNIEILRKLRNICSRKFKVTDAKEFGIHFLKDMARLKEYIHCKHDFPLNMDIFIPFYDNVKQYLKWKPSEKSLRVTIPVMESIMTDWELEVELVLVLLWEHFNTNIYSPFRTSGDGYDNIFENKSVSCLLNEVKSRFVSSVVWDERENSFEKFLKIFAVHAPRYRSKGKPMKTLWSRIYIKYERFQRIQNYSRIALNNIISVFLTLSLAFSIEREVNKLHEMMASLSFDKLCQMERKVKARALIACLFLLTENGFDTEKITKDILKEHKLAVRESDKTLISLYVECVEVFINNRHSYLQAPAIISALTGDWIQKYMTVCDRRERTKFLSIYDPLLTDLRADAIWWSAEEMEEIQERLISHVLPIVEGNMQPYVTRTAAQFLSLCIKNKKWAESYSIYNKWIQTKASAANVTSDFIACYYEIEGSISSLGIFSLEYEIDVVRCFISCYFLKEETSTSHILWKLVKSLPTIARHALNINYDWPEDDRLKSFVVLFGTCIEKCSVPGTKKDLKQFFNNCFTVLKDCCDLGLAPDVSRSVASRIYHFCAFLFVDWLSLIHENEASPIFNTIIKSVFLPTTKYSHYSTLPPALLEYNNECLLPLIRVLIELYKRGHSHIKVILHNVIDFNFPNERESSESFYKAHPFYKCLLDAKMVKDFSSLLQNMFLSKLHLIYDHQGENCIRLFSFVTCPSARDTIFSSGIYEILNSAKEMNDYNLSSCTVDYVSKCVEESPYCRNSLKFALEILGTNQFSGHMENIWNFLTLLKCECRDEILECMQSVMQEINIFDNEEEVEW